jgi:hypothetical protein
MKDVCNEFACIVYNNSTISKLPNPSKTVNQHSFQFQFHPVTPTPVPLTVAKVAQNRASEKSPEVITSGDRIDEPFKWL